MLTAQLVEDHHLILPAWFQAREELRGCVLIHIDEHLDYMRRPPAEQRALVQAQDRLAQVPGDIHLLDYGLYCVEDFLSSVTQLGIFDTIVWIKPRQVSPPISHCLEHVKNFDFIRAEEIRPLAAPRQGVILSDLTLTLADSGCEDFLPAPGSRVVVDIDLDFADKASAQDLQFAQAIMARLKREHEIVAVSLCRSVNGGYIEAERAAGFLAQIAGSLGLAGIEPLATNYLLPEPLNQGLRLIREHRFLEATPFFSRRIEGVDDAVVAHYLGHAHQLGGDNRQAWRAWNIALSLNPRQWLTRVQAGFLLVASEIRADIEAGCQLLAGALAERPDSFRLNLALAQITHFKLQQPEMARPYFESARRIRPLSPEVQSLTSQFLGAIN